MLWPCNIYSSTVCSLLLLKKLLIEIMATTCVQRREIEINLRIWLRDSAAKAVWAEGKSPGRAEGKSLHISLNSSSINI